MCTTAHVFGEAFKKFHVKLSSDKRASGANSWGPMSGKPLIVWSYRPIELPCDVVKCGPTVDDSFEIEYLTSSAETSENEEYEEDEENSAFSFAPLYSTLVFIKPFSGVQNMQLRNRKIKASGKRRGRLSLTTSTAGYSSEEEKEPLDAPEEEKEEIVHDTYSDDEMPALLSSDQLDKEPNSDRSKKEPSSDRSKKEPSSDQLDKENGYISTWMEHDASRTEITKDSADASFGSDKPDAQVTEQDFTEGDLREYDPNKAKHEPDHANVDKLKNTRLTPLLTIAVFLTLLSAAVYILMNI